MPDRIVNGVRVRVQSTWLGGQTIVIPRQQLANGQRIPELHVKIKQSSRLYNGNVDLQVLTKFLSAQTIGANGTDTAIFFNDAYDRNLTGAIRFTDLSGKAAGEFSVFNFGSSTVTNVPFVSDFAVNIDVPKLQVVIRTANARLVHALASFGEVPAMMTTCQGLNSANDPQAAWLHRRRHAVHRKDGKNCMRKSGKPFARVRIFVGLTAAAVACAVTTAAAAQTEPSGQGPHIIVGSEACATRTAVSRILNALSFAAVSISIKDGKGTRVDVVFDETSTPVENLLSLYILRAAIDAVAGGQKSPLSYDIVLPNREKSEFSGATRILDDGVFAIAKALRFKAEGRERDFNIVSTGYTNEYLQICAKH